MRNIYTREYNESLASADCPSKSRVLSFLRKQDIHCVTAGRYADAVTGKTVEDADWRWYKLGEWIWSDRDIYHFEKYDLELEPEFVKIALS